MTLRLLTLILALTAYAVASHGRDLDAVARCASNSVLVEATSSWGSGTLLVRTNPLGERLIFVITAGHVVASGTPSFDFSVFLPVGGTKAWKFPARAVKFTSVKPADVGILLLVGTNSPPVTGLTLTKCKKIRQGQEIFGISSPFGSDGMNSASFGDVSFLGRQIEGCRLMQTTCLVYPGASGGGLYDSTGGYLGLTVAFRAPGVGYAVTLDDLLVWLDGNSLGWLLDPLKDAPSRALILKGVL